MKPKIVIGKGRILAVGTAKDFSPGGVINETLKEIIKENDT